jgi:putative component of membrane protein insertase Oxa1/YidC/SpoIIIJ protein YidD
VSAAAAFAHDLPRALLLAAIRFYKRRLSPHKGFACAYRVHTGHCSCSTLGYRAISRYGVVHGLGVLRLRLDRCHEAFERFGRRPVGRGQRGFVDCDVPCDASCVHLPDCDTGPCEVLNCLDCGDCGWPRSRQERERDRQRRRRAG